MTYFRNLLVISACAFIAFPKIATAVSLTQKQISHNIIGKTLAAKRLGISVRILYKRDGTITMKSAIMSGSGTWSYSNDGICMMMKSGPRRGKTCVTFNHLGGNKYRNSEGLKFTIRQ